MKGIAIALAIPLLWFSLNGLVQVLRKPSELFFPVSDALHKTPAETWDSYGSFFRRHATKRITPDFLAALAQVEASGNPVARTYWRWSLVRNPFSIYRPATSAVGLFQITDGNFEQARRFCIHDHVVVREGAWDDFESCWFNAFYARVIPSHSIELTSAFLDHQVRRIFRQFPVVAPSRRAEQELAAVIHLCGQGAARRIARQGYQWRADQKCGDHDLSAYLAKVARYQKRFVQLSRKE